MIKKHKIKKIINLIEIIFNVFSFLVFIILESFSFFNKSILYSDKDNDLNNEVNITEINDEPII